MKQNRGNTMKHSDPTYVTFMGVKIDNLTYGEVHQKIRNNIERGGYICLTDVGNVMRATEDKDMLEAVNQSLISIADGMPLAWYGKLLKCRKIERISGTELMTRLLEQTNGLKHYLLGDTDHTIIKIIEKAKQRNNELRITGHSPPFKNEFNDSDNNIMMHKINEESPDIVWVSFGGGKQDKWMHQNLHMLSRGVMIGVGAAFRFYIGELKIPPKILQSLGLQWLFSRMINNPKNWLRTAMNNRIQFIIHFPLELITARRGFSRYDREPLVPSVNINKLT